MAEWRVEWLGAQSPSHLQPQVLECFQRVGLEFDGTLAPVAARLPGCRDRIVDRVRRCQRGLRGRWAWW